MSGSTRPRCIAIVGPTGVGKTHMAEELALVVGGEIVSADSMQVYRGMDIGTAKPPLPRRVRYHCLDLATPGESYSAARFQVDARRAIADIASRGLVPILAGGTGLYVRAALDDWDIPQGHAGTDVRDRLLKDLAELGPAAMHARLADRDPQAAAIIHPNNSRRVIRALEMCEGGTSYAVQADRFAERRSFCETTFVGLTMDRELLYARIDARCDRMIEDGLLGEVASLLEMGFRSALTAMQAIGYKEIVPVLEKDADLDSAMASVKRASRRYAKRQLTWFRADPRVQWVDVTKLSQGEALDRVRGLISSD